MRNGEEEENRGGGGGRKVRGELRRWKKRPAPATTADEFPRGRDEDYLRGRRGEGIPLRNPGDLLNLDADRLISFYPFWIHLGSISMDSVGQKKDIGGI